jgi:beta-lactam-binding protein with PASTA domain
MKKFLKILGIVLLILIVVLATAPVLFKGKIIKLANEQLSSILNAKASFSDLNISLFRNFPNWLSG